MSDKSKCDDVRVEAAAKVMAAFSDYWGHMTDTLREKFRERARAVLAAAPQSASPAGKEGGNG